ncbi:hypothetical protein SK128_013518, partial [Halocaridina rubra]
HVEIGALLSTPWLVHLHLAQNEKRQAKKFQHRSPSQGFVYDDDEDGITPQHSEERDSKQ